MGKKRRLLDEYRFSGFRPRAEVKGIFGDSNAIVIKLKRAQKKQYAGVAARFIGVTTTRRCVLYGIYPAGMPEYIWRQKFGEYSAGSAGK